MSFLEIVGFVGFLGFSSWISKLDLLDCWIPTFFFGLLDLLDSKKTNFFLDLLDCWIDAKKKNNLGFARKIEEDDNFLRSQDRQKIFYKKWTIFVAD